MNAQLEGLQRHFGEEYKSVSSRYESEYDLLKSQVEREKLAIEAAKSQVSELSQQKRE